MTGNSAYRSIVSSRTSRTFTFCLSPVYASNAGVTSELLSKAGLTERELMDYLCPRQKCLKLYLFRRVGKRFDPTFDTI